MNEHARTHVHPSTDGSALRFCDGVARIVSSRARDADSPSVVELTMPPGSTSPLATHDEDTTVVVLEGRVGFTVDGRTLTAEPRTKLRVPAGAPFTHRVDEGGRARWLVVSAEGRFERFVREVARPADEPVPAGVGRADAVAFTAAAAANGIELLDVVKAAPRPVRPRQRSFRLAAAPRLAPVGA